ncbi:MAG: isoprenylcysteine carboxylmethyltransferase family protein [Caenibius sp.]
MSRALLMLVSIVCYALMFVALLYLIGFVAALPMLPTHVDKGIEGPLLQAVLVDLGLIALFGIQHSVMARPAFKAAWTRVVPPPIERSIYCLATAAVLWVMFAFWHPIAGALWTVDAPGLRLVMWTFSGLGWATVLLATFLLNHFELFGLAQAWRHLRGKPAPGPVFRKPFFYRLVRHPIYFGILLGIWATPDMTYSHVLLAAGFTVYILIGVRHEERDLLASLGDDYRQYRKDVGMVLPGLGKTRY